jgi:hypothetical protein
VQRDYQGDDGERTDESHTERCSALHILRNPRTVDNSAKGCSTTIEIQGGG